MSRRLTARISDGGDAYALAADLIPKRGAAKLQSSAARKLARAAFRGSRARARCSFKPARSSR